MSYIRLYRVKKENANLIFFVSAKVCDTVLFEELIVVLLCELLLPINSLENCLRVTVQGSRTTFKIKIFFFF